VETLHYLAEAGNLERMGITGNQISCCFRAVWDFSYDPVSLEKETKKGGGGVP